MNNKIMINDNKKIERQVEITLKGIPKKKKNKILKKAKSKNTIKTIMTKNINNSKKNTRKTEKTNIAIPEKNEIKSTLTLKSIPLQIMIIVTKMKK